MCALLCAAERECSDYTWHGRGDNLYFSYVCSLFREMPAAFVPCTNCFSLSLKDYMLDGVCQATDMNVKGVRYQTSARDCARYCQGQRDCQYWSWMGPAFPHTQNVCLLFSTCSVVTPCPQGGCKAGHRFATRDELFEERTHKASMVEASSFNRTTMDSYEETAGNGTWVINVDTNTTAMQHFQNQTMAEEELCHFLLIPGGDILENCFVAENQIQPEYMGRPSLPPSVRPMSAMLDGEVWPIDCLYDDICWTYNIREGKPLICFF